MSSTFVSRFHVRWMIRRDMSHVLGIEQQDKGGWTEEKFLENLRNRNTIGMVVEKDEMTIVGYMVYTLHKKSLEIVNLKVDSGYRRQGIGRKIINKLKSKLSTHGRNQLEIAVPDHMLSMHMFLKSQGFLGYVSPGDDVYKFFYVD